MQKRRGPVCGVLLVVQIDMVESVALDERFRHRSTRVVHSPTLASHRTPAPDP